MARHYLLLEGGCVQISRTLKETGVLQVGHGIWIYEDRNDQYALIRHINHNDQTGVVEVSCTCTIEELKLAYLVDPGVWVFMPPTADLGPDAIKRHRDKFLEDVEKLRAKLATK